MLPAPKNSVLAVEWRVSEHQEGPASDDRRSTRKERRRRAVDRETPERRYSPITLASNVQGGVVGTEDGGRDPVEALDVVDLILDEVEPR
jgi:hypothetical protein